MAHKRKASATKGQVAGRKASVANKDGTPKPVRAEEHLPHFVAEELARLNEQPLQPGRIVVPDDVRMLGQPIFQPPAGGRIIQVPGNLQRHSLVAGQVFYTLPMQLLNAIGKAIPALTGSDCWEVDQHLSAVNDDHSTWVGFIDGRPLHYTLLRPAMSLPVDAETVGHQGSNINDAQLRRAIRTADRQRDWSATIARAYAGWLNTQSQFHAERDSIFQGRPRRISLLPSAVATLRGEETTDEERAFLIRWRLLELAGPGLPVPMRPMIGGRIPLSILRQLMDAGGVINLPDIFPISSRDELRNMLQNAVSSNSSSVVHLAAWLKLVASNNPAKNAITRWARVFEVQHYWTTIDARYAEQLHRNRTALVAALAEFFGYTESSIKADLRLVAKNLGNA